MKLLGLTATLLFLTTVAFAAEPFELPKKDELLVTTAAALPLRESTPDPSFGGKAPKIGMLNKGEVVKVISSKQYVSIFGLEVWLEVEKEKEPGVHGWVFAGMNKELQAGKSALSPVGAAPFEEDSED